MPRFAAGPGADGPDSDGQHLPGHFNDALAWSKAHPDETGDAAIAKVESQPWDPSVESPVAFPQMLAMMGTEPEAVHGPGDAFLADPARVMDRVQFLCKKVQEAGKLETNAPQKVSTPTEASKQVIAIEPAQPQTAYVPADQPTVCGSWWCPSYPPYPHPPAPIAAARAAAAHVHRLRARPGPGHRQRGEADQDVQRRPRLQARAALSV